MPRSSPRKAWQHGEGHPRCRRRSASSAPAVRQPSTESRGSVMSKEDRNQLGIIGAGRIGQTMARIAQRAGHPVVIANSRGPDSLTSVVSALGDGVSAATVEQAAAASIVVLAVPWSQVPAAVRGLDWAGQIVIDATNDFDPSDLDGRTSSELVADLVKPARVVKTANTLAAGL